MQEIHLVVGLGEVGRPLLDVISARVPAYGVDIEPQPIPEGPCGVLHLCFPFEIDDFVGEAERYVKSYRPRVTVVNSTVAAAIARRLWERVGGLVAHSPVRGKHVRMQEELLRYRKFIGGVTPEAAEAVREHFESVGMETTVLGSSEATELAKLTETTYFGVLIAWAQEVQRLCSTLGVEYDEVAGFYEEIGYLPPVKYTPGVIGGHCVMPNIAILKTVYDSGLLEWIERSNQLRTANLLTDPEPIDSPVQSVRPRVKSS